MFIDVLHSRRPKIEYVSPAICEAVFSSTSFPTLLLDALPVRPGVTGLRIEFSGGGFELFWDNYPGAICYTVYRVNNALDPFGAYTVVAECITDPRYNPPDFEDPFDPDLPTCYLVTVITLEGETRFSDPVCNFTVPDCTTCSFPPTGGDNCLCWPLEGEIVNPGDVGALATGWAVYDSVTNRAFVLTGNSLYALNPDVLVVNNPVTGTLSPVVTDLITEIGPTGLVLANNNLYVVSFFFDNDLGERFLRITRINPVTLTVTGTWISAGEDFFEFGQALGELVYDSVNGRLYFTGPTLGGNGTAINVFNISAGTFTRFDDSGLLFGSHGIRVAYDVTTNKIYAVKLFVNDPDNRVEIMGFSAVSFAQTSTFVVPGANDPGLGNTAFYQRLYSASGGILYHSGYTQGGINAVSIFNIAGNTIETVLPVMAGALTFRNNCGIMCVAGVEAPGDTIQFTLASNTVLCQLTGGAFSQSIVAVPLKGKLYVPKPDTGTILIYKSP